MMSTFVVQSVLFVKSIFVKTMFQYLISSLLHGAQVSVCILPKTKLYKLYLYLYISINAKWTRLECLISHHRNNVRLSVHEWVRGHPSKTSGRKGGGVNLNFALCPH